MTANIALGDPRHRQDRPHLRPRPRPGRLARTWSRSARGAPSVPGRSPRSTALAPRTAPTPTWWPTRRRRRLRRQPARAAPRARPAGLRGRQARALREAADPRPGRGRGDGAPGPRARPLPDGGDVDRLPPGGPRAARAAARPASSAPRATCTPSSVSSSTPPRDDRMLNPALGAGALLDMGIYPLTFAHLMLGEAESLQRQRAALRGRHRPRRRVHGALRRGALATIRPR